MAIEIYCSLSYNANRGVSFLKKQTILRRLSKHFIEKYMLLREQPVKIDRCIPELSIPEIRDTKSPS